MHLLLNGLYAVLLTVLSPVIVWRMLRHGRYRRGLAEKVFGKLPGSVAGRPVVWFHAVSVGEVIQLQKVVAGFRQHAGDTHAIVITTSTDTGFELARQRFADCAVSWFPLDFTWAVKAALTRVRPALVVLMELELWPNFVAECERQLVPVAVVNARMSERSAWRFGLLPRWARSMFSRLSLVAAQSEAAGQRLRKLGVPQERVVVTGSIKFDGVATDRGNPATLRLRALLGLQGPGPVFIAGSTQAPEEQYALDAWERARMRHPDLRLILVPRHRERFDEVAGLVESRGWPLRRRSRVEVSAAAGASETSDGSTAAPVILLDTIGELSACWGLADVAFVGGSFGSRGGQNMIEPAAYGACVLFGPNTRNFRDVVALFREAEACRELATPEDLYRALLELLNDPGARERLSHAAQQLVLRQQGATAETIVLLQRLLVDAAGQGADGVRVAA